MTLYGDRSDLYDLVFPPDFDAIGFFTERLRKGARVLDAGCGSGALAAALAERGFEPQGFDLSPAMIERARARGLGRFWVADLALGGGAEVQGLYDAIFCLGNGIAHLSGFETIRGCIKRLSGTLSVEGFMTIQVVDFELVRERGLTGLPTREGPGFRFERAYEWRDDHVAFKTRLFDVARAATYDDETTLYPVSLDELDAAAHFAGLVRTEGPYSNFLKAPRGEDLGLVVVYRAH